MKQEFKNVETFFLAISLFGFMGVIQHFINLNSKAFGIAFLTVGGVSFLIAKFQEIKQKKK